MEELAALLQDLEVPKCPRGPSPTRGDPPGQDPERLYSSVLKPRPPPAAPPPPGLGELERLLRDLSHAQRGLQDELLAQSPEDETKPEGSPPKRDSGTPPGPPDPPGGAPRSAATAELDRLLAELAESAAPPKPREERPDQGTCPGCGEPVRGEAVVTALGRTWHPDHFCCAHCGDPLGEQGFLEHGGRPFCPRDFRALFGPRCRRCSRPVCAAFVAALGGLWHPECFVCEECGAPFPGGSFFQRGGAPLCQRHFRAGGEGQPWGRG